MRSNFNKVASQQLKTALNNGYFFVNFTKISLAVLLRIPKFISVKPRKYERIQESYQKETFLKMFFEKKGL